ncbi:MAG: hypothetical protein AMS26_04205 [Bacteroides sp. SM23_62]|nr:MAG: hypothetical protein AMS26_04205 [Bacteroides sp. SM23_62]
MMNRTGTCAIFLVTLILLFSCKKDDEGPQLVAQTGPDALASIGDTVRLDLSASTGVIIKSSGRSRTSPAGIPSSTQRPIPPISSPGATDCTRYS